MVTSTNRNVGAFLLQKGGEVMVKVQVVKEFKDRENSLAVRKVGDIDI
ncbi:MAG: hypothetical protein MSH11_08385 [Ruminococcus sp.]|nr:hypothetical protein [Ruminococcus sp.]